MGMGMGMDVCVCVCVERESMDIQYMYVYSKRHVIIMTKLASAPPLPCFDLIWSDLI